MDKYLVIGNMKQSGKIHHANAQVYILDPHDSGRSYVMLKTRSGRLVKTWQPLKRITNLRIKAFSPDNPDHQWIEQEWWIYDNEAAQNKLDFARCWSGE